MTTTEAYEQSTPINSAPQYHDSQWIASMVFSFTAATFVMYVLTAHTFYVTKQRMLICWKRPYSDPMCSLSIINTFTLVAGLAVLTYIAIQLPLIVPPSEIFCPVYHTEATGCTPSPNNESSDGKWYALLTMTMCFQILLLVSILMPLHMHKRRMLHQGYNSDAMLPVIKRAAITASVCIVSDIANLVFSTTYYNKTVYINHMVYSGNLMINYVALICSAANWKEKVMPCLQMQENEMNYAASSVSQL
ncbi:unnamed protein product [Clavelina lepadiformis]|uniref:G-protein coupled receptors family 1 profile domain-containing protein n=1 Tax=Clavelina lepadiformis TaxID=159417 RepID=A0ABP0GH11_CLALP